MSLTTTYRAEIVIPQPQLQAHRGNILGSPCMDIMGRAVDKVIKERGGQRTNGFKDCNGGTHTCLLGVSTPAFPLGVGIDVDGQGRVLFRYETQKSDVKAAQAVCNGIARSYATIAVLRAQQKHGYRVSVVNEERESDGRAVQTVAVRD